MKSIVLPLLIVIVGCSPPPVVTVRERELVPVVQTKVVKPAIDPDWLKPCPTDKAREESYEEARRLAESRRKIITDCANADKAKIRSALESTP